MYGLHFKFFNTLGPVDTLSLTWLHKIGTWSWQKLQFSIKLHSVHFYRENILSSAARCFVMYCNIPRNVILQQNHDYNNTVVAYIYIDVFSTSYRHVSLKKIKTILYSRNVLNLKSSLFRKRNAWTYYCVPRYRNKLYKCGLCENAREIRKPRNKGGTNYTLWLAVAWAKNCRRSKKTNLIYFKRDSWIGEVD